MSANVLRIRDLAVRFRVAEGTVRAVDGVSFAVPQGRTVALVGESGSGKTVVSQSILRILPRAAEIDRGEILFFDPERPGTFVDIARLPPESRDMRMLRAGRIGIVFQEPMTSLSPLHTIGDQVSESLTLHRRLSRAEADEITVDMLRMVGFPEPAQALHRYPFELSGGLRQRAVIAMALVCRPALLVADEPTTALDVTVQAQILKLIRDLQQQLQMAVLIITHDLGVVANVADEIVVMYHGKVMERGSADDIFNAPRHDYLKALLRAVPRFDMAPGERLVPLREIKAEVGHLLKSRDAAPAPASGPLLAVSGLTKRYATRRRGLFGGAPAGHTVAVDDVGFEIARGECLGLVGESGCGKTTTSKIIMRALSPDEGEVRYNDHGTMRDVLALEGRGLFDYRRKVQFIFQDPFSSLNPRMTVLDLLMEPLEIHRIGDRAERLERVRELMTLVGLDPRFLRRYPHSFSGGQRQRIGIARALALHVSVQAQVLNLLKDLQDELGLTYLFISHNLAVVDYMADRIAVMCAGRLVELAPREVLFRDPRHPYTRALLAAVPKADPTARLDLSALMEGRASDPAAWPAPFTLGGDRRSRLMPLGDGHFVRADAAANL
jgi:peptide/nickel transport system ATP-binding protein